MNTFYSVTAFAVLLPLSFCDHNPEPDPESSLVIRTIDGTGKPIPAQLVYESIDCEYDFNHPEHTYSDNMGIAILKDIPAGSLQLYAEGFLYESYQCFHISGGKDTVTIYAAKIPTYVMVEDQSGRPVSGAEVTYFVNESGNCDYENKPGNALITNEDGKSVIYLPQNNTYKIQMEYGKNMAVQCFQPEQAPDTVLFTLNFR